MKNDYLQEVFSKELVKQFTESKSVISKIINEPIISSEMEKYEIIARRLKYGQQ